MCQLPLNKFHFHIAVVDGESLGKFNLQKVKQKHHIGQWSNDPFNQYCFYRNKEIDLDFFSSS